MALTEEQRNPWRAIVAGGDYNLTSQDWEDLLTELDSLYTEAPIAQPASAQTGWDAEFLAKRLCRVAKLAGVSMPENFTHEQVAEAAGTILGQIAAAMEAKPASAPSEQKPVSTCKTCNGAGGWESCASSTNYFWKECPDCKPNHAAPQPDRKAQRDALLGKVIEARQALQFANDTPCGPINDTIWMMHGPETLFDFLDAAIASVKGGAE